MIYCKQYAEARKFSVALGGFVMTEAAGTVWQQYVVVSSDELAEAAHAGLVLVDMAAEDAAQAKRDARKAKAKTRRDGIKAAYESCGMRRVRGNLGGTYWE